MSRKAYSQQERTALKKRLHEIGLDIYLKQGIQNVKLPEILQLAGISKPFFYTFYPSLGDLIIDIIDEQRISIMKLLEKTQADETLDWRGKIEAFLYPLLHHREHRFFILSPEEEVWLYQRLTKQCFDSFQKSQIAFYEDLLAAWEVPLTAIAPQIMGNYLLSSLLYETMPQPLSFLFHEYLDETAAANRLFIGHLNPAATKYTVNVCFFLLSGPALCIIKI